MPALSNTSRRARVRWAVQLAVSGLALGAIFSILPLRDVLATMRGIEARHWFATLAIFLIGHVVSAAKWQLLADSGAGFSVALRAHFGGLVANLWLPGVAGGDVVRAALLYRHVSDTTRLALGSLADRLVDTIGLLLIAAAGVLFALRYFASGVNLLIGIGIGLTALAAGAVIARRSHPLLLRRLPVGSRSRHIVEQLGTGAGALWRRPLRLVLCLALSMTVQIAFVVANIELATAAGVNAPIAVWFFAWPLSKIVATLPISMGGIGVREASLAGFLAPFGAAPAAVVATGLVWQSVLLTGGVIGALVLFLSDRALGRRSDLTDGAT